MKILVYDATLSEGSRAPETQFSARDRLRIALRLDDLGCEYVEAGWPGGWPGDAEVFKAAKSVSPRNARLCAFAVLRREGAPDKEPELRAALKSGAPVVTLSASVWEQRTGRKGGASAPHLAACVKQVRGRGKGAVVDLADFFDGWKASPAAALDRVAAAAKAGAEAVLLSDTLGGAMPHEVEQAVLAARKVAGDVRVGIRARDDLGLAVANTLAAVGKGARVVAGTVNGYGEGCGVANLVSVVADLQLKAGRSVLGERQMKSLTPLAHFVAELANLPAPRSAPFVGRDAFREVGAEPGRAGRVKAMHHVDPGAVGNRPQFAISDEHGRSRALGQARELGLVPPDDAGTRRLLENLAEWEQQGFRYEGAEASFELIMRSLAGRRKSYFRLRSYRTFDMWSSDGTRFTEASVIAAVGSEEAHTAATGVGPVHALDLALRRGLERFYPELHDMRLMDAKIRTLPSSAGTAGVARVLLESGDGRDRWGTAGVSEDLIEACCQALCDAIEYKLIKDDVAPKNT